MKSQKGITLISLTVYVIVMLIVVATLSVLSNFFFKNIKNGTKNIDPLTEYTKFTNFFTEEVNHNNIKVLDVKDSYIAFDDGVQYTFVQENKGVYRNQIKICNGVESCSFDYKIENGRNVVTVNIKIESIDEKTAEYTLRN